MAEQLPNPIELRAQARHHREEASRTLDPRARAMRAALATEYDSLAEAIEFEMAPTAAPR